LWGRGGGASSGSRARSFIAPALQAQHSLARRAILAVWLAGLWQQGWARCATPLSEAREFHKFLSCRWRFFSIFFSIFFSTAVKLVEKQVENQALPRVDYDVRRYRLLDLFLSFFLSFHFFFPFFFSFLSFRRNIIPGSTFINIPNSFIRKLKKKESDVSTWTDEAGACIHPPSNLWAQFFCFCFSFNKFLKFACFLLVSCSFVIITTQTKQSRRSKKKNRRLASQCFQRNS
jgi:hypothetical protein